MQNLDMDDFSGISVVISVYRHNTLRYGYS